MYRYAVTLLIALFAGLAGFAGFNALVDPFGIMGSPDLPGLTARDTRLYEDGGRVHVGDQLARGGERGIILGSSRTVDGFPRDPADLPGGFINAGMRGTNIFELSQAAALAAGSDSLRCVVMEQVPWPKPSILHRARRAAGGGSSYDDKIMRGRLAQAFGRLIRSRDDSGYFIVLSPAFPSRLLTAFPPGVPITRLTLDEALQRVATRVSCDDAKFEEDART